MSDSIRQLAQTLAEMAHLNDAHALFMRQVAECSPCLMWAKDLEHRYTFANSRMVTWLGGTLFADVRGRTDIELADRSRAQRPGDPDYHTFGEICSDSDSVTLAVGGVCRFLEFGQVRGNFCALQVMKAPLRDDERNIIGTVGSGVDVTERIMLRESILEDLRHLVEKHDLGDEFCVVLRRLNQYCDRHKFTERTKEKWENGHGH